MTRLKTPALLAALASAVAAAIVATGCRPSAQPGGAAPGAPAAQAAPAAAPEPRARPANFNALALDKRTLGPPAANLAALAAPAGGRRAPVHLDARLGVPSFAWASPTDAAAAAGASARAAAAGARRDPVAAARAHLAAQAASYGLTAADVKGAVATRVHDTGRGPVVVTFRQRPGGLEVFREEASVAMTRRLAPVAVAGSLSPGGAAAAAVARGAAAAALDAPAAVAAALTDLTGEAFAAADLSPGPARGAWSTFDLAPGLAAARAERLTRPAAAKQLWFRLPAGLELAWQVEVSLARTGDDGVLDYGVVVSALDGRLLFRIDHRSDQAFAYRVWASDPASLLPDDGPQGRLGTPHPTGLADGFQAPVTAPALVTLASLPFSQLDPWLPDGATETRGNNVDAYADLTAPDGFTPAADVPGSLDRRAAVTAPGVFDHPWDPALGPAATDDQIQAAVTQLFYDVNALHDWFYDAGFDESSGNAQALNFGRGGLEGDPIHAEAQDAGGSNNANMSTPPDGFPPRMQMYVWTNGDLARLTVATPAGIAGLRQARPALFGQTTFALAGTLEAASPPDACGPIAPAGGPGRIALVDRGACAFAAKVKNAQVAGFAGVVVRIVVSTQAPLTMSGTDATVTIPALLVDFPTGADLGGALAAGDAPSVLLEGAPGVPRDGTLDALVVAHEWGHYLTNRLVHDASGLDTAQARAMGEGWGDFVALLQAVREEDAAVAANGGWDGVYATAGWVGTGADFAGAPNQGAYYGIRRTPYSTDMGKAPLTFRHVTAGVALPAVTPPLVPNAFSNAEVHNAGEVWAGALWECYAGLLRDTLGAAPRLTFDEARRRMREYLVASLKLLPASPTFLEGRDALLAAATAGDPADAQRFWEAFATRGFGIGAAGPTDRFGTDNAGVVESFALGGDLVLEAVAFDGVTSGCDDQDGRLDAGEVGTLTFTLRNVGSSAVPAGTATVAASGAPISFPDGPAVAVGPAPVGGLATATVRVALASPAPRQLADLTLTFADAALARPLVATAQLATDLDVLPAASATDDLEGDRFLWTPGADPALSTASGFQRVATTALDHAILGPDPALPADLTLTSPPLHVGAGPFTVSWKQAFSFEADPVGTPGRAFYDGGVVELSDDGGATWLDVGGPAYVGAVTVTGFGNPLEGRPAFVGTSPGLPVAGGLDQVSLDLTLACTGGGPCAGRTVLLRFRIGTDLGGAGPLGWYVDDVAFGGLLGTPFDLVTDDRRACVNRAPVARAGADQEAGERTTVTLDGSGSADLDAGAALAWAWTQVAGPAVTLSGADGAAPSFVAPEVTGATDLTFRLVVDDGLLQSAPDEVTVTVLDVNRPPLASAGPDQVVDERTAVTLDGGASTDPDPGTILTYAWTQVSGPGVAFIRTTTARPRFTAPEVTGPTDLVFSLVVSDGVASSAADTVTVTVVNVNRPPVAVAADQAVDERGPVTLDGSASFDPDAGAVLIYAWAQVAGPPVALLGAGAAQATFTAPEVSGPTALAFELVVSDGEATSAPAAVTVTVRNVNRLPVAVATADPAADERTLVTLDGSASSDPDAGAALTYAWTQVAGPPVALTDPAAALPSFLAPEVAGPTDLTFELTVGDGEASSAPARVTVTILDVNRAPTADAGPAQAVDERSAVTLDGSASADPDAGTVLAFAWTQLSGPAVALAGADTPHPTFTAPEVASTTELTFGLAVSDGALAAAPATVTVTVRQVNRPPVAAPGPSRQVAERSTVTLDGSASADPDAGAVLAFAWTQVAGPAVILTSVTDPAPRFVAPEVTGPIDLVFRLTVDDGEAAASAEVTISVRDVNRVPTAAAAGQVADERTVVTLDGSASSDPDAGTVLTFAWTQVSGPPVALVGADGATPSFLAPEVAGPTDLVFQLTVGDGQAIATAVATVTVRNVNRPPVASAGAAQQVAEGASVTLSAAGSSDPDAGATLTYAWVQTGGPTVLLSGEGTATPAFVAPEVDAVAVLTFLVTVGDGEASSAASVSVTVENVDRPPVASAGPDLAVDERTAVTLDGTASFDPDPATLLQYAWTQRAGPPVQLGDATGPRLVFLAPEVTAATTLVFGLSVSDGHLTDESLVTVTVRNVNRPPTADAGPDLEADERDLVVLHGGATDADGAAGLRFAWAQVSGPPLALDGADSATLRFTAPEVAADAEVVLELTVSDGEAQATDRVTVRVRQANQAPVAVAGAAQTVDGGEVVALDASGSSDPDGDALTFAWTQTAGPAVALADAATATPTFTAPPGGATLRFQVTVGDGVASAQASVAVVVRAPAQAGSAGGGGCATGTSGPGSLAPLLFGLALLRRRRRTARGGAA